MASTLVGAPRRLRLRPGVVIAATALLVVACGVWGAVLSARGVALHLGFAPFYGAFDVRITPDAAKTLKERSRARGQDVRLGYSQRRQ